MKVHRVIALSPDQIGPAEMRVTNYYDGEWLILRVEGEPEQTYLTMSDTPQGDEARPEGFADVVGQMDGRTSWFYVPPETVDNVSEGGTIYLYLWTSPEDPSDGIRKDTLRGQGTVVRQRAARRDRRRTPDVPEMVVENVPPITVDADPSEDLVVEVKITGGLPPTTITSDVGAVRGRSIHISRRNPRDEIVTVTALDSRGVSREMRFGLTVRAAIPPNAYTYQGRPYTYDGAAYTYGGA